jgi:outer membrane immunogenic protein
MGKSVRFVVLISGVLLLTSPVAKSFAEEGNSPRWDGFYMGLTAGYSAAKFDMKSTTPAIGGYSIPNGTYFTFPGNAANVSASGSGSLLSNNAIAGGVFGYNLRIGNSQLAGVELDLSALGANKTTTHATAYISGTAAAYNSPQTTFRTNADNFSALAIKFGTIVDDTLFYVKGGPAISMISFNSNFSDSKSYESNNRSETKLGWMLGLGVEHKIQNNISIKADYLHAEFGPVSNTSYNLRETGVANFPNQPFQSSLKTSLDMLRVGVNMHF